MLDEAINDYLLWMISKGYAESTWRQAERVLNCFSHFVKKANISMENAFNLDTLQVFQKEHLSHVYAVRGLWRYLYGQGRISQPLKQKPPLPDVYEEYLLYYGTLKNIHDHSIAHIKRVLSALNDYLKQESICLSEIKINDIDIFLAQYNSSYAPQTQRHNRSFVRGFLRYLYHVRKIVHRDLAPLLVGAPLYAQAKPPKFLRPHQVQRLFASLRNSSSWDLRANAMLHLAFSLGLRPKEISLLSLDDISFRQAEVSLQDRKCANPIKLPLPGSTVKAIGAYIVGARAKSEERSLFLKFNAPYGPVSPSTVCNDIGTCMRKANLDSSAYWLRHTYAQSLLENGASIFEIKEMLGHDRIQTTQGYLHIHTTLMREVLFDETL